MKLAMAANLAKGAQGFVEAYRGQQMTNAQMQQAQFQREVMKLQMQKLQQEVGPMQVDMTKLNALRGAAKAGLVSEGTYDRAAKEFYDTIKTPAQAQLFSRTVQRAANPAQVSPAAAQPAPSAAVSDSTPTPTEPPAEAAPEEHPAITSLNPYERHLFEKMLTNDVSLERVVNALRVQGMRNEGSKDVATIRANASMSNARTRADAKGGASKDPRETALLNSWKTLTSRQPGLTESKQELADQAAAIADIYRREYGRSISPGEIGADTEPAGKKIRVTSPRGQTGMIPESNWPQAEAAGYKKAED